MKVAHWAHTVHWKSYSGFRILPSSGEPWGARESKGGFMLYQKKTLWDVLSKHVRHQKGISAHIFRQSLQEHIHNVVHCYSCEEYMKKRELEKEVQTQCTLSPLRNWPITAWSRANVRDVQTYTPWPRAGKVWGEGTSKLSDFLTSSPDRVRWSHKSDEARVVNGLLDF